MFGPLPCLIIGVGLILFLILYLRFHAFLALIASAIAVAVLSDRIPLDESIYLVANRFGEMMGAIGILLAFAAIIGKCLMDSGAAERIVRAFSRLFGAGRENYSLLSSGFVLSIPVFFDTVFYLLAPLARAVYARRKSQYVLIVCAAAAGGAVTHALVPPTPGPIAVAEELGVSIGLTMLIGVLASIIPVIVGGIFYARWIDRRMNVVPKDVLGVSQEELETTAGKPDSELPSLFASALPFALPVLLLAGSSVLIQVAGSGLLRLSDLNDPGVFLAKIKSADDPVSLHLNESLSGNTQMVLAGYDISTAPSLKLQKTVLDDINAAVKSASLYEESRFQDINLRPEATALLGQNVKKYALIRLNRMLLEDAYPDDLKRCSLGIVKWCEHFGG